MNQFSEVEIKLDASTITPKQFEAWLESRGVSLDAFLTDYKVVAGDDIYYRRGTDVVRHRFDGKHQKSVLTVKKRKSTKSIMDRIEIDLPIHDSVKPNMVKEFLKQTGWKKEFRISKISYIYKFHAEHHVACIAYYKVWNKDKSATFLEVEIERESKCSAKRAKQVLKYWLEEIKKDLIKNAEPLNYSLYEFFTQDTK